MVTIDTFRQDTDKEVNGTWCDGPRETRFKIARWGNPKFREKVRELIAAKKEELGLVSIKDENVKVWEAALVECEKEAAAYTILLD